MSLPHYPPWTHSGACLTEASATCSSFYLGTTKHDIVGRFPTIGGGGLVRTQGGSGAPAFRAVHTHGDFFARSYGHPEDQNNNNNKFAFIFRPVSKRTDT